MLPRSSLDSESAHPMRYHESSILTAALMEASSLTALSPVDGRYAAVAAPSACAFFSEAALIRERVRVEAA